MEKGQGERLTVLDEIRSKATGMSQPLDLENLMARGLITKAGAWYRVSNIHALPENARLQINRFERDSRGLKVQFLHMSKAGTRALEQLKQI